MLPELPLVRFPLALCISAPILGKLGKLGLLASSSEHRALHHLDVHVLLELAGRLLELVDKGSLGKVKCLSKPLIIIEFRGNVVEQ